MKLPPHVEEFLAKLRGAESVLVVTHHDADGISSAGVLARALHSLGKEYDVLVLRQFYPETLETIPYADHDAVIFTDLGGSYLDLLGKIDDSPVIDHHDNQDTSSSHLFHPLQMGYSPDRDASASTLSSLLSFRLYEDYKTLAYGLIGACGDRQILNGRFEGLNRVLVSRAVRNGVITVYRDLVLHGIRFRDLPWVLYNSTDPYLPGLTGNEEGIYELLERAGLLQRSLSRELRYTDLSIDERRRFFTLLALHLLRNGWTPDEVRALVGETYEINGNPGWMSTVRTFSTLINALGRQMDVETAVGLLLDRFELLERAERTLERHRRVLIDAVSFAEGRVEDMGSFLFVDGRRKIPHYVAGTVAEILRKNHKRPVVVVSLDEDGSLKVSVRGGTDMGTVFREVAKEVGGEGGGHSEAAGARIPPDSLSDFLSLLSEKLEARLLSPGNNTLPHT